MTQAQLAQKINEKPVVINQYENGKAIPNGLVSCFFCLYLPFYLNRKHPCLTLAFAIFIQLISKIERALGTKLPRPAKKK